MEASSKISTDIYELCNTTCCHLKNCFAHNVKILHLVGRNNSIENNELFFLNVRWLTYKSRRSFYVILSMFKTSAFKLHRWRYVGIFFLLYCVRCVCSYGGDRTEKKYRGYRGSVKKRKHAFVLFMPTFQPYTY